MIDYGEDYMEFGEGWVARSDGTMVNHSLGKIRTEDGIIISMNQDDNEIEFGENEFYQIFEDEQYGS